jgi:hypothetical protein
MSARSQTIDMDEADQRRLAATLYNHVWAMLEREDRAERDDELMVHAAHTSRFLWESVGGPVQHTRGEWQVSRVYTTVLRPEPALHHARLCLDICLQNEIVGFDLAFAHEALARAYALGGDREAAAEHRLQAERIAGRIQDIDDRELVLGDLASISL